jgi:hypothetical protein
MNKLCLRAVLAGIFLFQGQLALAQEDIVLGTPSFAGSACPGTAEPPTITRDEASGTLTISYKSFVAGARGKGTDRQSCNMALPVILPPGRSLELSRPQIQGQLTLAKKSSARVAAEIFVPGTTGPKAELVLTAKRRTLRKYLVSDRGALVLPCESQSTLRANVSALVTKASPQDRSSASVEDVQFIAVLKPCQ